MALQYCDVPGDLFAVEAAPEGAAVVLRLHVQPGAGRAAVLGRHGDALRVKVAPPPLEGRANAAVLELVAELLDVPASAVELASGDKSRDKRVRVRNVTAEEVTRLLDEALEQAGRTVGGRNLHGRRGR